MKNKLAVLTFGLVPTQASGAFAWGGFGGRGTVNPGMMNQGMIGYSAHGNPGMARGMPESGMMSAAWASVEIPQEIKDKQVEIQKLRINLRKAALAPSVLR